MGKIIFITHDIGIYGASKSFQITLKNLIEKGIIKKSEVIIVYPKTFRKFAKIITEKQINNSYLKNLPNKEEWILPTSFGINVMNVEYNNIFSNEIRRIFKILLLYIYWLFKYKKKIKNESIEKIYLNSIILWPVLLVLPKKIKIIMHIREILDFNSNFIAKFAKKLIIKKCHKLIAIDKQTAKDFENYKEKLVIITNPVDMKKARDYKENKYKYLCEKYKIDPKKIHIALIGRINRRKGHGFFCKLAKDSDINNIFEFIIVGKGQNEYLNIILENTKKMDNLRYLGEIKNIDEIYAITHVVIRCDDFFPLGRTVWEGLYSGCKVLLPLNKGDDIREINKYLNKEVFLYNSRDIKSVITELEKIIKYGFDEKNLPSDNIAENIKKTKKIFNL